MAAENASLASSGTEPETSWLPMVAIVLAQIPMAFNVNALPVSIGGIVESFGAPPTAIGSAIVAYSLFIAGFVMLGAKIGALLGPRRVFRAMVALFGAAMAVMALSPTAAIMIAAQALAGAAAAALVPSLVMLIASHYQHRRQAQALSWLGASEALGGVLAFLVAGSLGAWVGWRWAFGLLVLLAAGVFVLSRRLNPVAGRAGLRIDGIGAALAAAAIVLISLGFNSLNAWGLLLARPAAPFAAFGLSPAPVMIVVGILLGQIFLAWLRRRRAAGKTPLLALEVAETPRQRSVVLLMFVVILLGSGVAFLIPLYIQIVQGRSSLETALAIIPYSLSIFAAAILVPNLYRSLSERRIARLAFVVAAGLLLLASVIRNEWETLAVVFALIVVGLGQGALVTLLFNALAAASPAELAGDVGSLRGTANNLAGAVGTAVAGALLIGVLSASITTSLVANPVIPAELKGQVDLDNVTFVANDRLERALARTTAVPEQVAEAVRINTEARLRALRACLLLLTGLALLAVFPAGGLAGFAADR